MHSDVLIGPYRLSLALCFSETSCSPLIRIDNLMFKKNSKKPLKKNLLLGIPTNIAVGPLGFRAELDVDPKSKSDHLLCCYLGTNQPDSSATLDEKDPGPSRIVPHKVEQEAPGPSTSETLTPAVAIGVTEPDNSHPGERSWSHHCCRCL